MVNPDESSSPQSFPSTRWTLIAKATDVDEGERAAALEELCRMYWPPVFTFIRSMGASQVEAEDLTQGFFADFLAREDFKKPRPERGKLRSFLLGAVSHFMANDWRDRRRLKRGGGATLLSLDGLTDAGHGGSGICLLEPRDSLTPEALFDRQWALTLLSEVLGELRVRYEERGQAELFDRLKHVVSPGAIGGTHAEIAEQLSMKEGAVKVAAHRLRKRYGSLLREAVADTLLDGEDVELELKLLMSSFG